MRTITIAMAAVFSMPLFIGSCFERNQHHYPDKIVMPREGGTVTVKGDACLVYFKLYDDKGDCVAYGGTVKEDTFVKSHDWLTLKAPMNAPELILSAEPLEGKKRRMKVYSLLGYDEMEIEVVQQ